MRDPRDPDDQFAPSEGPTPSDDDADVGEALEEYISEMDHSLGVDDHTTAEEQLDGDTIDDRTRREQPQRVRPRNRLDITDTTVDAYHDEGALLASEAEGFGPEAPEQAAMHIRPDAPGAVDHPDDYVIDEGS